MRAHLLFAIQILSQINKRFDIAGYLDLLPFTLQLVTRPESHEGDYMTAMDLAPHPFRHRFHDLINSGNLIL